MLRTNALFSERVARGLAALIAFGALTACADPSAPAPTPSPSPSPIIIIGGQPIVFNALLRAIGNPDTKPPTAVEGHLQLKIEETDAGLIANWQAVVVNPECESSLLLGGAIYLIQDSEDFPNPEDEAVLDLRSVQKELRCGDNLLEGAVGISGELAERLIVGPEYFIAVFFLNGGGALAGTLQLAGMETSPTR